jgi:hypothetical protein
MSKSEHEEHENKLSVVMIIGGTPYPPMEFPLGQKLQGLVESALAKTQHVGQAPDGWELIHDGTVLDLNKHLRDFGFSDGVKLFLNPKVSQSGSAA